MKGERLSGAAEEDTGLNVLRKIRAFQWVWQQWEGQRGEGESEKDGMY